MHYEKPPIFNPILAGLDIGNNMSDSLCKRKEKKNIDFSYIPVLGQLQQM